MKTVKINKFKNSFLYEKKYIRKIITKQSYYFFNSKKKVISKFFKYQHFIGVLIKKGQKIQSCGILFKILKILKLNYLIKFNINKLKFKAFSLVCNSLNKINPRLKHRLFYRSGRKYISPQITKNNKLMSKSFMNVIKNCKESKSNQNFTLKVAAELVNIINNEGKTYNSITKDWYSVLQDSRKLLYFFERKKKFFFIKKKKRKLKKKKINWKLKNKKKWLYWQYKKLLYITKYKKYKPSFKKSLKIKIC